MGRPSKYNDKIALAICRRISEGESLRKICEDDGMPTRATVINWTFKHDEFFDHYARARQIQAQLLADELFDIADAKEGDVQRDRLRADTRKWYLCKVLPKIYGEKKALEITGADGNPIETIVYAKDFESI